jgi:hypothetical protein
MLKNKWFTIGGVLVALVSLMVMGGAMFDGSLATFDNPTLAACNMTGLTVSGKLTLGATAYVEEYLEGNLKTRFTGRAGSYSGYVSRFNVSSYPIEWKAVISFRDGSGNNTEQYELAVTCSSENAGEVTFSEVELDALGAY